MLARRLARPELTTGDKFSIGPKKFSGLNSLKAAANAPLKKSKITKLDKYKLYHRKK